MNKSIKTQSVQMMRAPDGAGGSEGHKMESYGYPNGGSYHTDMVNGGSAKPAAKGRPLPIECGSGANNGGLIKK